MFGSRVMGRWILGGQFEDFVYFPESGSWRV